MWDVYLLSVERQHWNSGLLRVAGLDEAGRGPLAGPVIAAAVILDPPFAEAEEHAALEGLTDSKKLTAGQRDAFYKLLIESPAVWVGIGRAEVEEIDTLNIYRATQRAMMRALAALAPPPEHALVDGLPVADLPCASTAIVGGDGTSLSIAAASVVAKVARDREMLELDRLYPAYEFARHKGYGCRTHIQRLFEQGPCPAHRRSFRPVREAAAILEIAVREGRAPDCLAGLTRDRQRKDYPAASRFVQHDLLPETPDPRERRDSGKA